jgi:hypothetical protein
MGGPKLPAGACGAALLPLLLLLLSGTATAALLELAAEPRSPSNGPLQHYSNKTKVR